MHTSHIENQSKLEKLIRDSVSIGMFEQEIHQKFCGCQLCINDVKPIKPPPQPRQTSPNQFKLVEIEALSFFLQQSSEYGHPRMLFIPDIYIVQDSLFCYTNQSGRLRVKSGISSYQAKKMFDERRKKITGKGQIYSLTTIAKEKNRQKENNIIVVGIEGQKLLINEIELKKIFMKRKNDPFWSETAAMFYLPISSYVPIEYKQWVYIRNKSMAVKVDKLIQAIGQQVDNYDDKVNIDESYKNSKSMMQQMNLSMSMFSSQQLQTSTYKKKPMRISQLLPMGSSQEFNLMRSQTMPMNNVEDLFLETVAYIELASRNRILSAKFEYLFDDENRPYLIRIVELIAHELKPSQINYLHDRYQNLEQIGEEELLKLKKQLDNEDQKQLWNLCTSILSQCLEQRKIKLKIQTFLKPSQQDLKSIFIKLFPDFNSQAMLSQVNWKNELPVFMEKVRKHINNIIKEDEGVSILKRYGIVFYRTFD